VVAADEEADPGGPAGDGSAAGLVEGPLRSALGEARRVRPPALPRPQAEVEARAGAGDRDSRPGHHPHRRPLIPLFFHPAGDVHRTSPFSCLRGFIVNPDELPFSTARRRNLRLGVATYGELPESTAGCR